MRDFHAAGRSPAYGTSGMAATSMPAATLAAIDVLRAGGNAADAAVAAAAVQAVIEPQSTGIGGDVFCLYVPAATGRVHALNGSGRAAAAASLDWYERQGLSELDPASAHTVTIPGAVGAWETLLRAHGTKGLDELLRPAIGYAEQGWPVHDRVATDWAHALDRLRANDAASFMPGGAAPSPGHMFVQSALGATLRAIARDGARAFYEGPIAADMVAALRARGGLQTEADFAAGLQGADFVEPIRAPYRGYDLYECPPNGSGLLVLMMLGILEGFAPPPDGPLGALRLHRAIEAARLVYRDRDAFLADPAHAGVAVDRLLDPGYLAGLRALISDTRAMPALPPPGLAPSPGTGPRQQDTVYFCVVDRDGNACSFINSVANAFGSGIVAEASGVLLHNRGVYFSLHREHPNAIAPGKRPMHTLVPGMLMQHGRAVMPFGVMGGHFQPMGQTWVLTNMVDWGMDPQAALDLPRVFPFAGRVEVERGVPAGTVAQLARLGHDTAQIDLPHGGGQAIWIDHARGVLIGGSDPRKDGMALGY